MPVRPSGRARDARGLLAAVYSYCRRGSSAAAAVAVALSSPDKPTSRKRSTKDETPDGRMRQRCGFHVKPTV